MDPNATLKTLRTEINHLRNDIDNGTPDWDRMLTIADAVDALDGWFSTGGFLPDEWASVNDGEFHKAMHDIAVKAKVACPAGESCSGASFPGHPAHRVDPSLPWGTEAEWGDDL